MPVVRYDQSTWLAERARQATQIGPPQIPARHALPGAKASIAHDELLTLRDQGMADHEIVNLVNQRWRDANAHRAHVTDRWVRDTYRPALDRYRKAQQEAQAEILRKNAVMAQMVTDYETGHHAG